MDVKYNFFILSRSAILYSLLYKIKAKIMWI